jgi:hypothetical protein
MIRKTTLAVTAIAFALTLVANVDSASAAKGGGTGRGGNRMGMSRGYKNNFRNNFRKDFRYNRYWDRFCFGYPCYGFDVPVYNCVETPVCTEVVTEPVVPVVETPVCTTCEPVSTCGFYGSSWGYGRFHKDFRGHERHFERGGRMGHGRK